ncbi:ATP-binding protein [Methanoplanus endosymbiosus]|uniref:histidine kinase n=1 Tax=Methanoplanus endosymbiosus TaxID=33865 RepID=A0A9E7PQY1_9EURY|nr:ATP-binding protein [Methanoplanus endosymbiosus]UUX93324.1 ATP-binding protein [Methanoplanus endosymbiosus]
MPVINSVITVTTAFCLISAFITCGLGFFVYAQKPASTVHRLFLAVMLSATYWATGEFFIWQAESLQEVTIWLKFSSFWPITIALASHFILAFTGRLPHDKKKRRIILTACIYAPALILSIIGIFTECLFTAGYDPLAGYIYLPTQNNIICPIEIFYTTFIMLWALYVGFISWRRAVPEKTRRQNRLLFAGIITVVFFGALSGAVLPLFSIHTPNLVFFGLVIFSIIIIYTIQRYGLFTLSPETAVPEIMKTMPDGLILADQNGIIVAANKSATKIFPSLKEPAAGRSVSSLITDEEYLTISNILAEKGEISDFEIRITEKNHRYVSIAGSVVRDRNSIPSGTVLIIRDITHRKASETALRVANDKLSMLSRLTRHDIGNLVTALSGYLSILEGRIKSPEEKHYLSQATVIVDKIMLHLEFSRKYQAIGSKKPQWEKLRQIINSAKESLKQDNIEINVNISDIEMYADPLLEKVVYNLLENAVRHGDKITEITITTEEQKDGSLVLKFEDDGTGIPEEEKEKIFSYGYGRNTGFGLAFARELLSVTGIGITERGLSGKGASFEIQVPPDAWRKTGG